MYTYALLQHPDQALILPAGIQGPLKLLRGQFLSAIVEPDVAWDELERQDDRLIQAVLIHDRVLRDLFLQTPLLPLRFGTRFISESALITHLDTQASQYLQKLRQLQGKAEYTLKLIPLSPLEPTAPLPELQGRDYFLAKKRRYEAQAQWQQQQYQELTQLLETIGQRYPDHILAEPQAENQRIYLLISRDQESSFHTSFMQWQASCPNWQINVSEALPPYHFV